MTERFPLYYDGVHLRPRQLLGYWPGQNVGVVRDFFTRPPPSTANRDVAPYMLDPARRYGTRGLAWGTQWCLQRNPE